MKRLPKMTNGVLTRVRKLRTMETTKKINTPTHPILLTRKSITLARDKESIPRDMLVRDPMMILKRPNHGIWTMSGKMRTTLSSLKVPGLLKSITTESMMTLNLLVSATLPQTCFWCEC